MSYIEALIYAIGVVNHEVEDYELRSQTVYDRNGDPHWIAWNVALGDHAPPRPCSESGWPFAQALEPYRM